MLPSLLPSLPPSEPPKPLDLCGFMDRVRKCFIRQTPFREHKIAMCIFLLVVYYFSGKKVLIKMFMSMEPCDTIGKLVG